MGDEKRFPAEQVDAADVDAVVALCAKYDVDVLCSFLPVEFNPYTLQAALKARVHHMDASTTLSVPHPTDPFNQANVVLGETEIALSGEFEKIGKLGLMGIGVEPGMADWYCRYAADHFFDEIDEIGVRDGANLEIPGFKGISFGFSIWMTIEECTNPAVVWERDRGFYTVPPLSDPEPFYLPEGIGWVDVAHVEHEEVLHVGWFHDLLKGVKKATFKYALGDEFIQAMEVFKSVNMHSLKPVSVRGKEVRPRDVIEAAAPDPNEIGKRYVGQSVRRHLGARPQGRARAAGLPVPGRRQPGVRRALRHAGRGGADGVPRRDRARAARHRQARRLQGQPRGRRVPGAGVQLRRLRDACRASTGSPAAMLEMDSEYKRALDHARVRGAGRGSRRVSGAGAGRRPARGPAARAAAGSRARSPWSPAARRASGWRRRSGCSKREPPS